MKLCFRIRDRFKESYALLLIQGGNGECHCSLNHEKEKDGGHWVSLFYSYSIFYSKLFFSNLEEHFCIFVHSFDHVNQCWGCSIFCKDSPEHFMVYRVICLDEVYKDCPGGEAVGSAEVKCTFQDKIVAF